MTFVDPNSARRVIARDQKASRRMERESRAKAPLLLWAETAAVIVAADRVADLPAHEFMVPGGRYSPDELNPAILRLRETVQALRKRRSEEVPE